MKKLIRWFIDLIDGTDNPFEQDNYAKELEWDRSSNSDSNQASNYERN